MRRRKDWQRNHTKRQQREWRLNWLGAALRCALTSVAYKIRNIFRRGFYLSSPGLWWRDGAVPDGRPDACPPFSFSIFIYNGNVSSTKSSLYWLHVALLTPPPLSRLVCYIIERHASCKQHLIESGCLCRDVDGAKRLAFAPFAGHPIQSER